MLYFSLNSYYICSLCSPLLFWNYLERCTLSTQTQKRNYTNEPLQKEPRLYHWIPFSIIRYHWANQRYFSRTEWYQPHSITIGHNNLKFHSMVFEWHFI